ncbi:MATE family efflux transporter [Helicobacter bilis]|uniref:MATE family efflux transporter n=1 Tax=Helicobacter bilis TaxID=37372 RepID=UPI0026F21C43|nr:MATE family efflux transporter [Helicobacter bilis]MCI7411087.1 MATE family efflux transporter [Helicobacter bilis]MDD7297020.1 MATE family efflux transporter [Helicobacter bilis]MDY4400904.1 MATE family efflux transporter [Helicobacter bilis]
MANAKSNLNLASDSIPKLFFNYFIPMLLAMLAMASYSTIDGIFVNKKLGDDAMKAIVVVWPLFPAMMACSLMFSLGGASLISYYLAKGRANIARAIFSSIVYLLFPLSLLVGVLCYAYASSVIDFFAQGLTQNVHDMAVDYLRGTCVGLFGIILHPVLDICVVNDKRPRLAMFAMFLGAICNVIFNYLFLFVWEFGIIGSAYATTLGHIIGSLVLLWHYIESKHRALLLGFFNKNLANKIRTALPFICEKSGELYFVKVFNWNLLGRAIKYGSPYAASEASVGIVMWLYNQILKDIGGESALAIYSVILYAGFNFFTIMIALAESIQPIASFNYGMRLFNRLREILRFYIYVALGLSCVLYALFFTFSDFVVSLYLKDLELKAQSGVALNIYFIGYVFLSVNLIIAFYLQALQQALASFVVTIAYTLAFIVVLLPLMTHYYGIMGAWIAYPISQCCALCVSVVVLYYTTKRSEK